MSLREINKDHLEERTGLALVDVERPLPDHQDQLKFWTGHPTENFFVDLTIFATGEQARNQDKRHSGPFTSRPALIRQLAPAIQLRLTGTTGETARNYVSTLRAWWRLLDAVELTATQAGQQMVRVEDVRQLTSLHAIYAHGTNGRNAMPRNWFNNFKQIANLTLKALNASQLHWAAPENPAPVRYLPPDDDCKDLRFRLRQEWNSVLRYFALMDRVRTEHFQPTTDKEAMLLAHWHHINEVQQRTGKALPSSGELREELSRDRFRKKTDLSVHMLRLTAFPDRWKAEAAFHCCLIPSGWNPATLFSLDATNAHRWLRDHPRNPSRYLLVGTKARSGGAEQPVEGLWKSRAGPGYIIKTWLDRTAPLRKQLQAELTAEQEKYQQMEDRGESQDNLIAQAIVIQRKQEGCRSVWLFAGNKGEISWLRPRGQQIFHCEGVQVQFLTAFLARANQERAVRGQTPIPHITQSDFRDMFATYVWRVSGGNLFALMRALRHARARTTELYANTHHLNIERDEAIRRFLNNLLNLLGEDRFDITILSHLQRHGVVTPEMAQRLWEFRALQRSRINVGCRDPFHPPPDIQPPGTGKVCRTQRCLLCKTHAVILPESLDGVAMRVEELEFTKSTIPVDAWSDKLADELANGLAVLRLFRAEGVQDARKRWRLAIEGRQHRVPGLFPGVRQEETV